MVYQFLSAYIDQCHVLVFMFNLTTKQPVMSALVSVYSTYFGL